MWECKIIHYREFITDSPAEFNYSSLSGYKDSALDAYDQHGGIIEGGDAEGSAVGSILTTFGAFQSISFQV